MLPLSDDRHRGPVVPDLLLQVRTAGSPYTLELEDMVAAIRGERPALLGRAEALGQARVIDALYRPALSLVEGSSQIGDQVADVFDAD